MHATGMSPSIHQAVRIPPMVRRSVTANAPNDCFYREGRLIDERDGATAAGNTASAEGVSRSHHERFDAGGSRRSLFEYQQGARLVGESTERVRGRVGGSFAVRVKNEKRRVTEGVDSDAAESVTLGDEWREACTQEGTM